MIGRVYLALRNILRWLKSDFQCVRCGKTYHLYNFGYGKVICPNCYKGEKIWLIYEDKIMRRFNKKIDERRSEVDEGNRIHVETSMQVV